MKAIKICSKKYGVKYVHVDDDDHTLVSKFKWFVSTDNSRGSKTFYACTRVNGKNVMMHRFITKARKGEIIDHKDRNGLNNKKSNLRKVGFKENAVNVSIRSDNSTGYKGVDLIKRSGMYRARINNNNKSIFIGNFVTALDAAIAYNNAAITYFGEYAFLNKV